MCISLLLFFRLKKFFPAETLQTLVGSPRLMEIIGKEIFFFLKPQDLRDNMNR
jgi:hypothetical protein